MPILATKSENEGNFERIPAGTHQAVCYAVWDLGYQKTVWNGQEKVQRKVVISWEIDKKITNEGEYKGKRFVISNRYTLSLSEKANLRKHLESWSGKSFKEYEQTGYDLEQLIGKNCLLNIVHEEKNGKTYANISGVMAVPAGTNPLVAENGTEPPDWVKKIQSEAINEQDRPATTQEIQDAFAAASAEMEDIPPEEIPF
jgi:hypothetical protein